MYPTYPPPYPPRPGIVDARRRDIVYDAATQAEYDRKRNFSRFFSEHLGLPATSLQREELRDNIEQWYTDVVEEEHMYNNLARDVAALIERIESLTAVLTPIETSIPGLVATAQAQHANGTLQLHQVQNLENRLQEFWRIGDGLKAFHQRLFNRFGAFRIELPWIGENLQWRCDQIGSTIDRTRLDGFLNTVATMKQEIRSRDPAATATAVPRAMRHHPTDRKRKRERRYSNEMIRDADDVAQDRARLAAPIAGLGSIPLGSYLPGNKKYRWSGDLIRPWDVAETFPAGNGQTIVKLFVRTDSNDTIVDRIVEKTTRFRSRWQWQRPVNWVGKTPGMTPERNLVPAEWYMQALLSSCQDGRCVVGVRGFPLIASKTWETRMFLEYCNGGDLGDVLTAYRNANRWVPASFLYMLFKALAEAALLMKGGSTTGTREDWKEIVHRDMKPLNVFLNEPQPDYFPMYPQPKLADFGLAIMTSKDDPTNPVQYNQNEGTRGFLPPEQIQWRDEETGAPVHDFKVLSPANVWGIGIVMRTLMLRQVETGSVPPRCRTMDIARTPTYARFPNNCRAEYGMWLTAMVEQCLYIDPAERPTLESLNRQLDNIIQNGQRMHAAQSGPLLGRKECEYKIGMAAPSRLFPPPPPAGRPAEQEQRLDVEKLKEQRKQEMSERRKRQRELADRFETGRVGGPNKKTKT
ncbi:hypothetical protein PRZ48_004298 [Zasmidium cellare]|uniref:Protein kinase domain-containing protein n=1 Tax=Zasmidium cellare TaxID=395010 RepID=A0ABR0EQK3_ZASCE|nr:hypothetical protein PRZ48_004298 [Zasmidium cellare]